MEYTGTMDPTGTGLANWPLWAPDSSHVMCVALPDSGTTAELYLASPDGIYNQKISGPLVAGGAVSSFGFLWGP